MVEARNAIPTRRVKMEVIKKAVLLAAGRGTRMGNLTSEAAKPMLAVRGKPVLAHIIDGLKSVGVIDFLVIVGWRGESVRNFFRDGASFGVRIYYATQTVQDGTGRAIEPARQFAGSDAFILSYGDILVGAENYALLTSLAADVEAIVSVKRDEDVAKGGAVFVNDRFELVDIREKPKPGELTSPWYNAGIYVFRPSIFDFSARLERSSRGEYQLTDAIRNLARSGKKIQALELSGSWADVRDPEILAKLNRET